MIKEELYVHDIPRSGVGCSSMNIILFSYMASRCIEMQLTFCASTVAGQNVFFFFWGGGGKHGRAKSREVPG